MNLQSLRIVSITFALGLLGLGCGKGGGVQGEPCEFDLNCDDNVECTVNRCVEEMCVYTLSQEPQCDGACLEDIDCEDGDDCTEDTCAGDSICDSVTIPDCEPTSGPPSGNFITSVPENGQAYEFGIYSHDAIYQAYLEDQEEAAAALAVGACVLTTFTTPGQITLLPIGNVVIKDGGTIIVDIAPTGNNRYESPFQIAVGAVLDVEITGSDNVTATTCTDVIARPGFLSFDNLSFSGGTTFFKTTTYDPVPADRVFLQFDYFGTEPQTMRCRLDPAAGTFTMPDADFAALGQSGTVRAFSVNIDRCTVEASDGPRDILFETNSGTGNGGYTKETDPP